MLIVFHLALHVLLGAALALSLRTGRSPAPVRTTRRLTVALYLDLLTAAPLCAYQLRLWPAYALGYALDPLLAAEVYQWVPVATLGVLLAMPTSLCAGYALTLAAARRGRAWLAAGVPVAAAVAAAALGAAHAEEFTVIGDFAGYWRGGGTWAVGHVHVQMLLFVYAAAIAALWPLSRRQAATG